jgi:hypothetical protein
MTKIFSGCPAAGKTRVLGSASYQRGDEAISREESQRSGVLELRPKGIKRWREVADP